MWHHAHRIMFGTLPRTVRTIFALVAGVHLLYFFVLPWMIARRKTRNPRVRRYLQWVVATPSLLGGLLKVQAQHDLMRLAHMEGLHELAAAQGFAILRHSYLPPTLAAEVRGRLADALEGLGRMDEASEQRRLADTDLKGAPKQDTAWYINRGRQLAAQRDFAGSCRAYEEGLEIAPPGPNDARILLTLHLATDLFMAGRLDESAQRADEAAALAPDPERQFTALRQAGAAYSDLGRLDEAEDRKQRCVALAEALGDPKRLADCLGDVAAIARKRGRLTEALAGCDRAAAAVRNTRHLETIRYETFRSMGRFEEALATVDRASRMDPLPTPRREQMIQGMFSFARAGLLMDLGRLDDVQTHLDAALANVKGDAKLSLWCDASAVRLAAMQGHRDAALRSLDRVETRLAEFAGDHNTCAGVLGNLGRAALAFGEYQRALDYWQQYLDVPPQPVDVPTAYYHLGECHRGLGDDSSARASYRAAVDTGLDTHYARLAQSRLRTILA